MDGKTWVLWADAVVEWNLLYGSLNIQSNIYHKAEEEQRMVGGKEGFCWAHSSSELLYRSWNFDEVSQSANPVESRVL